MNARWSHVERELQRARGARRALVFVAAAVAGAAALVGVASASLRGAALMLLPGALLAALVWVLGVPRCPECGASLLGRGERPGSAARPRTVDVERTRRCPRCSARFEP